MPTTFDFSKDVVSFAVLSLSASIAEALALLRESRTLYAVICDADQPQTLVQERHLAAFAGDTARMLAEVLSLFPPLLVTDQEREIPLADLKEFARLLQLTPQPPGLLLCSNRQIRGVIPRSAVASTLSSALPMMGQLPKRLYGEIAVPAHTYICRKCSAPQPRRRPRIGDVVPECPRNWRHGPMEVE
jgi:hypothetical protein